MTKARRFPQTKPAKAEVEEEAPRRPADKAWRAHSDKSSPHGVLPDGNHR